MIKNISVQCLLLAASVLGIGGCAGSGTDPQPPTEGVLTQAVIKTPPIGVPINCRTPDLALSGAASSSAPTIIITNDVTCLPDQTTAPNFADIFLDSYSEIVDSYTQFVDQCYASNNTSFYAHIKGRFPWAFDGQDVWLDDGDDVTVSQTLFEYLLQARRDVYDAWQADPQCPGAALDQWTKTNHPDVYDDINYIRSDIASRRTMSDFDGDGIADYANYEGSQTWNIRKSSSAKTMKYSLGSSTQVPVPGDYDNDGRTDAAVFDTTTGVWSWIRSSNGANGSGQFGQSGDLPVANDFDGDGQTDLAVWRPSNGTWYVSTSSGAGVLTRQWGTQGDAPVTGDYDGDGKADYAVFRPSQNRWWILYSDGGQQGVIDVGNSAQGDLPAAGDYDGDGKSDAAVFNSNTGDWTIRDSSTGVVRTVDWGTFADLRAPNDYNGDGQTDVGVWRPSTSQWFNWQSGTGLQIGPPWGASGSTPISSAFMY